MIIVINKLIINCLLIQIASPACTELEVVMMDWLAKILKLPEFFLASSGGAGGGVIQGTASESLLVTLLSARNKAVNEIKAEQPDLTESFIRSKLILYCTEQAHSSVERATLLATVICKKLPVDDRFSMRGSALIEAIERDRKDGFFPFYVTKNIRKQWL